MGHMAELLHEEFANWIRAQPGMAGPDEQECGVCKKSFNTRDDVKLIRHFRGFCAQDVMSSLRADHAKEIHRAVSEEREACAQIADQGGDGEDIAADIRTRARGTR